MTIETLKYFCRAIFELLFNDGQIICVIEQMNNACNIFILFLLIKF